MNKLKVLLCIILCYHFWMLRFYCCDTFKYIDVSTNVCYDYMNKIRSDKDFNSEYDNFSFLFNIDDHQTHSVSIKILDYTDYDRNMSNQCCNYTHYLFEDKKHTIQDTVKIYGSIGVISSLIKRNHKAKLDVNIDDNTYFDIIISNLIDQNKIMIENYKDVNGKYIVNLYGEEYEDPSSNGNIIWIKKNDAIGVTKMDIEDKCNPLFYAYKDCTKLITSITTPSGSSVNSKIGSVKNSSNESNGSKFSVKSVKEQKKEAKQQKQLLKQQQMMGKKQQKAKTQNESK